MLAPFSRQLHTKKVVKREEDECGIYKKKNCCMHAWMHASTYLPPSSKSWMKTESFCCCCCCCFYGFVGCRKKLSADHGRQRQTFSPFLVCSACVLLDGCRSLHVKWGSRRRRSNRETEGGRETFVGRCRSLWYVKLMTLQLQLFFT